MPYAVARGQVYFAVIGCLTLFALGSSLGAQRLTLVPAVATPGQIVRGELYNDTATATYYVRSCEVRTLRHSGELFDVGVGYASPRTVLPVEGCDQVLVLPPGASVSFSLTAPVIAGSYTIITADLRRAAARLDVAAAVPGAQDVCFYPTGMALPQTAHEVDFLVPANTTWEFANTGAIRHRFGANDIIRVFRPGSTTAVASASLAGISVAAGGVTRVTLPIAGLTPGPYTVEATFVDANAGPVTTRSGIQQSGARADLHMHAGHDLRPGGGIAMAVSVTGFSTTGPDPYYFAMLGYQPGSTPLPGGLRIPLDLTDPLATASVTSGLNGLLANNTGRVSNSNPSGMPLFAGAAENLSVELPLIPGLEGLVLRLAVLAVDPQLTTWGASQPEEIVLR